MHVSEGFEIVLIDH